MKRLNSNIFLIGLMLTLSGCDGFAMFVNAPVIPLEKQSPEYIYTQAEIAIEKQQYERAMYCFRTFIKLHGHHPKGELAHLQLINCYVSSKNTYHVLKEITDFIDRYPESKHRKRLEKQQEQLQEKLIRDSQLNNHRQSATSLFVGALGLWIVLSFLISNILHL